MLYAVTFTDGRAVEMEGPLTVTSKYYKFGSEKFERTSVALIEDLNQQIESDEGEDSEEEQ